MSVGDGNVSSLPFHHHLIDFFQITLAQHIGPIIFWSMKSIRNLILYHLRELEAVGH